MERALVILNKLSMISDSKISAQIYNSLGILCKNAGKLEEALTYFNQSLGILIKLYGTEYKVDIGIFYNNVGLILIE